MVVITLDDISRFVTAPVTVKSPVLTVVIEFELMFMVTSCWYWGNPLGTLVSLLPLRSTVSRGVVAGIF